MMNKTHIWPLRVYFEDTDAGGIVYHANYLKFTERARTEMLRDMGTNHAQMVKEDGLIFVVKNISIEYHASAKLDNALTVHTLVKALGNASLTLQQNVLREDVILATSDVVLVLINTFGKPCRIPAAIRGKIDAMQAS
jgi:acyl-CoA thioester hydrolase